MSATAAVSVRFDKPLPHFGMVRATVGPYEVVPGVSVQSTQLLVACGSTLGVITPEQTTCGMRDPHTVFGALLRAIHALRARPDRRAAVWETYFDLGNIAPDSDDLVALLAMLEESLRWNKAISGYAYDIVVWNQGLCDGGAPSSYNAAVFVAQPGADHARLDELTDYMMGGPGTQHADGRVLVQFRIGQ